VQITECENAEDATFWLRAHCGVLTRAELDHNEEAARKFKDLESSYKAWMIAAMDEGT
jgi:hypothetical protein